jgi:hypothetical protein
LFVNFRFSASKNIRTHGVQAARNISSAGPEASENYSQFDPRIGPGFAAVFEFESPLEAFILCPCLNASRYFFHC